MSEFEYLVATDMWAGSYDGREIRVVACRFAERLDALAKERFGMPWDELGEEEYIAVLAEVRYDVAFWARGGSI